MTGGLLQLVAKSVHDKFLTHEPQVTNFKTIYRRHTNFTIDDYLLKFNNRLDFGKRSFCELRKFGDLLHKLYLQIRIPDIEIEFDELSQQDIIDKLAEHGMIWVPSDTTANTITSSDLEDINKIINTRIVNLEQEISNIDTMIERLNTTFMPENYVNNSDEQYYNAILDSAMDFDEYQVVFRYLLAFYGGIEQFVLLNANMTELLIARYFITRLFARNGLSGGQSIFHFDEDSDMYIILDLIDVSFDTDTVTMDTFFNRKLDEFFIYTQGNIHRTTDAYTIIYQYINRYNATFGFLNEVQEFRTALQDSFYSNYYNNMLMARQIQINIDNQMNFRIYRDEDTSGKPFINLTSPTVCGSTTLTDEFTSLFDITLFKPENDHFYSEFVKSEVEKLRDDMANYYNTPIYKSYMDNPDLFSKLTLTNIGTYTATGDITGVENIVYLNFAPVIATDDIYDAIVEYVNTLELGDAGERATFITTVNAIRTDLLTGGGNNLISRTFDSSIVPDIKLIVNDCNNPNMIYYSDFRRDIKHKYNDLHYNNMEIVIIRYLTEVATAIDTNFTSPTLTDEQKNNVLEVVNMFANRSLPSYEKYKVNNNMYNGIGTNPFNSSTAKYIDAPASIWNDLYKLNIDNYNNFYQNIRFNQGEGLELGIMFKRFRVSSEGAAISGQGNSYGYRLGNFIIPNTYIFDLYRYNDTEYQIQEFGGTTTETIVTRADSIFGIPNISIPGGTNWFEEFDKMFNNYPLQSTTDTDRLAAVASLTTDLPQREFYYDYYYKIRDEIFDKNGFDPLIKDSVLGEAIATRQNVFSVSTILDDIDNDFTLLINSQGNPFGVDQAKADLYDEIHDPSFNLDADEQFNLFKIVSNETKETLYDQLSFLTANYNGLNAATDILDYFVDKVLAVSTLSEIADMRKHTKEEFHEDVLEFYKNKKEDLERQICDIVGGLTTAEEAYINNINELISTDEQNGLDRIIKDYIDFNNLDTIETSLP